MRTRWYLNWKVKKFLHFKYIYQYHCDNLKKVLLGNKIINIYGQFSYLVSTTKWLAYFWLTKEHISFYWVTRKWADPLGMLYQLI